MKTNGYSEVEEKKHGWGRCDQVLRHVIDMDDTCEQALLRID